jgi:hypothetical protein
MSRIHATNLDAQVKPNTNSHYCDDKAVSRFREIANTCQEEGFELIEDAIN